jgi:hypothetical protein
VGAADTMILQVGDVPKSSHIANLLPEEELRKYTTLLPGQQPKPEEPKEVRHSACQLVHTISVIKMLQGPCASWAEESTVQFVFVFMSKNVFSDYGMCVRRRQSKSMRPTSAISFSRKWDGNLERVSVQMRAARCFEMCPRCGQHSFDAPPQSRGISDACMQLKSRVNEHDARHAHRGKHLDKQTKSRAVLVQVSLTCACVVAGRARGSRGCCDSESRPL